jgi:hypothetical protein
MAARFLVHHAEDVPRDFDQIALQLAPVPLVEHVVQFVVAQVQHAFEHGIGFADQLHVAVLDAVMDHLDVVPGPARTDPLATRDVFLGTDLGGNRLKDRLDQWPSGGGTAGHHAGAFERPLFAAGDARPDEQQPLALDVFRPPLGIRKMRVPAVDDHVAGGQQRNQRVDELVDGRPGLDQHHHLAG